MTTCLVALGSNAGSREAAIGDALTEIEAVGQVLSHSRLRHSRPVGGPPGQGAFLNATAVIETDVAPLPLLGRLQEIEARHGRQRGVRWAARTLDLDLLLYDEQVIESAELTVPHPRMSYRRFVLETAAEIAGPMLHPRIGWTIDRLLYHLNAAADRVAILSPAEVERRGLAVRLEEWLGGRVRTIAGPPHAAGLPLWPPVWTTWLALNLGTVGSPRQPDLEAAEYPVEGRPKLTIILDTISPSLSEASPDWPALRLPRDRGPTLALRTTDPAEIDAEVFAAFQAVWPELCPPRPNA
jgi:2-amino-4-hydroxy-6-hydroxymethyldihydropteridine diphosphokinase